MEPAPIQGLVAAPFTPFHKDGSLHLEIVPAYYSMLRQNNIAGAFICGSTGEGVSLTIKERMKVAEVWAAVSKQDPSFRVITLAGGNSLTECAELSKHAASCGLDAIAFTSPSYFKPANVDALAASCEVVAAAAPELPFYYYHIPVLTGVDFPMLSLLQRIHERIPNFAGIKYTHEDFMDYASCMHFANGKYEMLWGRDETFLSALVLGARAAVGSTFNYAAPLYHDLIRAFHQGDLEQARKKQQQAVDMISLLGKYGGIATGKAFMKAIGLDCGEFRLPVLNMKTEQYVQFTRDLEAIGFEQYQSRLATQTIAG